MVNVGYVRVADADNEEEVMTQLGTIRVKAAEMGVLLLPGDIYIERGDKGYFSLITRPQGKLLYKRLRDAKDAGRIFISDVSRVAGHIDVMVTLADLMATLGVEFVVADKGLSSPELKMLQAIRDGLLAPMEARIAALSNAIRGVLRSWDSPTVKHVTRIRPAINEARKALKEHGSE